MIWIVVIILSLVMFKLGVLSVLVVLLSLGLKVALLVLIVISIFCMWRWYRCRKGRI